MNTSFQNLIKDLKKIMKIFFYYLTGKQEFYRLIQRAISTFESVYPTSLNPKTSLQRPRITMSWYYSSRFVLLKTYLFSCTLISSISILVEKWVFIQNLKDLTTGLSFKNLVLFIFFFNLGNLVKSNYTYDILFRETRKMISTKYYFSLQKVMIFF